MTDFSEDLIQGTINYKIEDFSKVLPDLSTLSDYHLMEKFDGILEFLNAPQLVGSLA